MNEIDELRAEVDRLRVALADETATTRRHMSTAEEAINMLLRVAIPGAAAAHAALAELINVIKAAGGDTTEKEALLARISAGFKSMEASAAKGPRP